MALMDVYAPFDITPVRGEGVWLFDEKGRKWLDCCSGIAVSSLGHGHPRLIAALEEQANLLWHVSNFFPIPAQKELAEKLVAHSFADKAFFCNSGVEAMEALIKLARRYHYVKGHPEKIKIITLNHAFHGRSLLTLSAAGKEEFLLGCGPKALGFEHIDASPEALEQAVCDETAAILIEPIQGEGGINLCSYDFLQTARRLCDEKNILLLFDEIQCGVGRCGTLWSYQNAGVVPDAMALAKGLGGGFPVGAVLARDWAAEGMGRGVHGTTFGGNPLAMRVSKAVFDVVLEEGFLSHVQEMGVLCVQKMEALIKKHPTLFDQVRGKGLMLGLHCLIPNMQLIKALQRYAVLTVPAGDNIVRFLPPLTIEEAEIDFMAEALEKAAQEIEKTKHPTSA